MSMDTTFPDNAAMYRAITDPVVWQIGYWLIIAGEGLTLVGSRSLGVQSRHLVDRVDDESVGF